MKKLGISFIIIFISAITASSQIHDSHTCSESKIRLHQKLNTFNKGKYMDKSGFSYDLNYYRLEFEADPAVRAITGTVTSYFTVKGSSFSSIIFDLNHNGMLVDSVKYHDAKITNYDLSDYELSIDLPAVISPETLDSITVYYHGVPENNGLGSFSTSSHNGHPILWTLSEPYGARDWWPCKQSLDDKIDSLDIYITNPDEYIGASNGKLISETTSIDLTTSHWKHRHPITTYLVAIAITNYSVYSDVISLNSGDDVDYINYVFPEDLSYAQASTPNLIDVMQLFSELYIDYPFKDEKYGHAQFAWGGGMEHQTMSFMVNFSHHLMAHELAHQWFGDYVTCGSWEDIWLNEGFATYLDGMTHEHNLNDDGVSFNDWKQGKINHIIGLPDGSVFVDDTTNVSRIFSSRLSYSKGAIVLHMLRKKIGDENFFTGIQNYLNDPEIGNGYANTEDLQHHLEQTYGSSVQEFLNDWFYGEGYPIYDIYYSQSPEGMVNVTINQTQSHSSVSFFEMGVPILFEGVSEDTLVYFENTMNEQSFSFIPDFEITAASFDPYNDIISTNSIVLRVDTFDENNKVYLNPNPARDKITVTFLERIMPNKIEITDLYGKKVREYSKIESPVFKLEFDIRDLKPGLYILSFEQDKERYSKKFIKN